MDSNCCTHQMTEISSFFPNVLPCLLSYNKQGSTLAKNGEISVIWSVQQLESINFGVLVQQIYVICRFISPYFLVVWLKPS